MPIPPGIWTVIYPWSGLLVPDLTFAVPLADQVLKDPVAEPKSKYAGEKKDPPEDCL